MLIQNCAIIGNCDVTYSTYHPLFQFELIYLIQSRYNYRISEVLNLSLESLQNDFNVCVRLSKCQEYSYIRDVEIYPQLLELFTITHNNSFTVTYKNYYHYLKRVHPEILIKTAGKNSKVTHSFRYKNARALKSITSNKKIIKAKLHHQSVKSQDYYLKNKTSK